MVFHHIAAIIGYRRRAGHTESATTVVLANPLGDGEPSSAKIPAKGGSNEERGDRDEDEA